MYFYAYRGLFWVVLLVFFRTTVGLNTILDNTGQRASSVDGYRTRSHSTYLILAPRALRADETYRVHIHLFRIYQQSVRVKASIRKDGHEYASAETVFNQPSSRSIQMKMLPDATPGEYTLHVQGSADKYGYSVLFHNETKLEFQTKRISVFIQTDRIFYQKRDTAQFRVIAVTPDLLPVKSGSINIYWKDSLGMTVRRWIGQQLYMGVYDASIPLGHPFNYGPMTIEVEGWGYTYSKTVMLEKHYPDLFFVNVTSPPMVQENDFAIGGMVRALHIQDTLINGNATVKYEIRPPGQVDNFPVIEETVPYMDGATTFLLPLSKVRELSPTLPGTDIRIEASVYSYFYKETRAGFDWTTIGGNEVKLRFLGGTVRTFKPNAPLKLYMAVYNADGSRYSESHYRQVLVQVSMRSQTGVTEGLPEQAILIPDDGIVRYEVTPKNGVEMITVRATHGGVSRNYEELTAYRHYTEQGEYISITTSSESPKVDSYMVFTVKLTTFVEQVHYTVAAGGRLVLDDTLYMHSKQKTFSIAASRDMVPNARIVVYAVIAQEEVIADSLSFYVDGASRKVDLKVMKDRDFSGNTATATIRSDPSTFFSLSATRQDLYQAAKSREDESKFFLTHYQIQEELETYDVNVNKSFSYTWWNEEGLREMSHFPAPSHAIDANTTFLFAGLAVFTDAKLTRIQAAESCNITRGNLPCFDGSCYQLDQACDGVRQCVDGADEMGCPSLEPSDIFRPDDYARLEKHWDHLIAGLFAWRKGFTMPNGEVQVTLDQSMKPILWVVGGFTLHPTFGLAIIEPPVLVFNERPFFMQGRLPRVARKGEQIGFQLTLFNYWTQTQEVLLTLLGSDDYVFVNVEEGGMASSYAPRVTSGDIMLMVTLNPDSSKMIHIPVLPKRIGRVQITVNGVSPTVRQTITQAVVISMDGVTNFYHTPYFLDLVNSGSLVIPDLEIPVPERFYDPDRDLHLYVPGSARATVSVAGDVIGPFGGNYVRFNIWNTFERNIEGNGEGQLFEFAYNLHFLSFLENTNQISPAERENVLNGLVVALPAMYSHIRADGAVAKRYGGITRTSVRLASQYLEVLSYASDTEWESTLYIDTNILNLVAGRLIQSVNRTTGEVYPDLEPYDIKIQYGLMDSNGKSRNLIYSAYAAIGLSKALPRLNGAVQSSASSTKDLIANYLSRFLPDITDPFELCLVTYALHAAGHKSQSDAFVLMDRARIETEFLYWSRNPIPEIPTEIINTVPFLQPVPEPTIDQSTAVSATSYALMVYLLKNKISDALPIMKWIQLQRYTDHTFLAPQDSIVAIQALRQYGEAVTNRELFNTHISLYSTSSSSWSPNLILNNTNFVRDHLFPVLPNVYGSIKPRAEGTGLGLIQLTTEVNVEFQKLLKQPLEKYYSVEVDDLHFSGRNFSSMTMKLCISWLRPDISPVGGDTNVRVEIPSGYECVKRKIRAANRQSDLQSARPRYSAGRSLFVFYLNYVETDKRCMTFTCDRWAPVANTTIQHKIEVFDSINPAIYSSSIYTTYELSLLHICRVCGSFQCPYCPFYNASSKPWTSLWCSAIPFLLMLYVSLERFGGLHSYSQHDASQ